MKKMAVCALAVMLCAGMTTACTNTKKAPEATTQEETATSSVNFGKGLNEDGTLEGVNATDYVTLCDYSAINISKEDVTASKDEVQSQIDSLMENYKKTEQVKDKKVKKGDTVNIDYKGTVDGKEFAGGSATGFDLEIGSGTFIEGFEDQLVGHAPGETVSVKVTFPKDYQSEDVAGKDAVFETKINYILKETEQKLTDQFVKENLQSAYGYTSVKDMKKKIKENLEDSKKADYISNYMLKNSTFKEIPEEMVNERVDIQVEELKRSLSQSGYTIEQYLSQNGLKDEKELKDHYYSDCETITKVFLVADAVAKNQKITVTDQDVKEYFNGQDYSSIEQYYGMPYIHRVILNNLVWKAIEKTAVIK